jgi:uncharacterized protein YyaL (SSP411 family)
VIARQHSNIFDVRASRKFPPPQAGWLCYVAFMGAAPIHKPNRLVHENSPYLLQHAYNPVDWYPWGREAFEKARRENKPIFLSIGYSTCHWCHVMERESFENEEIAELMNKYFVSIKLDREERPDIDKIYMTAVQATTGSGGWPMSVFLTPDLKPFYCGTYFPPESRYGRPGFKELIQRVHDVWESNRDGVVQQAKQITQALADHTTIRGDRDTELDDAPLKLGFEQFRSSYDPGHGGFGPAPKFPRPSVLNFLFRYFARTGDVGARDMALHTLRAMGEGGMFDQLGGGFHRYSVDERWLVSHFEKMLYDQAQLVSSYIDAYQITHDPVFADIARRTCNYVLRDMTSPAGGFYSAEDADSEGVEGKFYVWTREEIDQVLGGPRSVEAADIFCRYYGVEAEGNWEHGNNVLHVALSIEQTAKLFNKSESEVRAILADGRAKLFAARQKRVRPHRDEKILTAWNGLMITALARAAQVLDEPRYLAAAQRAARHFNAIPHLARCGMAPAVVDDYAFLANGLVDLYEANFDPQWLLKAIELTDTMIELFYDSKDGAFFMTTGQDESVIVRAKEDYDGAEPSGNSIAALLLFRLAQYTDQANYREKAEETLRAFGNHLLKAPHAVPQMLCALDFALSKPKQIIIAVPPVGTVDAMVRVVREKFLPNRIVALADDRLVTLMPYIKKMKPVDGQATAYVCSDFTCQSPTTDPERLAELLQ